MNHRAPTTHTEPTTHTKHGAGGGSMPGTALERWLNELERLDAVLSAQADYLDAIEHGGRGGPPDPFVGTPGLPELPHDLTPYARDLVQRNADVTSRAVALSALLRPRHQRPLHLTTPERGTRFERKA